jgi:hypothetical protein
MSVEMGPKLSDEQIQSDQPKRDSEEVLMTNRRIFSFSIFAAAILALYLPVLATAQGTYDPYGRNRDYGRNGDYRSDRGYDDGYGRYDSSYLRDSIRRLDRLSRDFDRDLDRELDHSGENGTRHEDHLNADAKQFRRAVVDLKNAFNERNLDSSADEAHRVLDAASHLEDVSSHHFDNDRLVSEWSEITQELTVISDAYGIRGANHGENNRNRRRNNDDYRRNDDYRTNRSQNNDWWRRLPWPN